MVASIEATDGELPPPPAPRPRAPASMVVLATLAVLAAAWAAQGLILPILLAMFFAMVGNPILRGLRRLYVPRFVGALVVLLGGLAATGMLAWQLAGPVRGWIEEAPRQLRSLTPRLQQMAKPVQSASAAAESIAKVADVGPKQRVQLVEIKSGGTLQWLAATPRMLASVLAVVLLTFFFMVYGERLQRHAIAILPDRQRKKLTVDIMTSIEHEVSRYILTISIINTLLGMALAGCLWALGVRGPEALMWGTIVALLNFAPYVGAFIGVFLMLLMGFVNFDTIGASLLPAAVYLGLHTLEGQLITPIVLGRRMALSPLILIIALMVFGFLFGIIGLLLAVPLLVCAKIALVRVEGMDRWARLLE
ncbi:AI-2E family transporter [Luteimonas yindakuii]|uniref:AI-2E family transporter n=1 Tax=Luteimonas yindakuii TaxID=2565782 RepID=A0A4Z1R7G6_9GAMM|nr:AI-2E family transporter [Luteimonas yindakuii]QCO68460.1 AI-2E family transporter [Luteimonas yindakuii]TKS54886.1 AI-2E family transporter [Luteimonas yindakuii]